MNKQRLKSGFVLFEILLASVLAMVLFGIIFQNYLSGKNIYNTQSQIAELSDNFRFTDFILRQTIMHAGFAGCRKISELNFTNHIGKDWEFNPIYGYDNAQGPKYLVNKIVPNTDVIVITKANSDISEIVSDIGPGATTILAKHNPTTEANQFLLISDCKNAEIFIAQQNKSKTIVTLNKLINNYQSKSAQVSRMEKIAFFISHPTKSSLKSLYYQINNGAKEELISEISDMKIIYGVDLQGQGRVTTYLKATPITAHNLWDKVLSVEITLKPQNQKLAQKEWKIYIKLRER